MRQPLAITPTSVAAATLVGACLERGPAATGGARDRRDDERPREGSERRRPNREIPHERVGRHGDPHLDENGDHQRRQSVDRRDLGAVQHPREPVPSNAVGGHASRDEENERHAGRAGQQRGGDGPADPGRSSVGGRGDDPDRHMMEQARDEPSDPRRRRERATDPRQPEREPDDLAGEGHGQEGRRSPRGGDRPPGGDASGPAVGRRRASAIGQTSRVLRRAGPRIRAGGHAPRASATSCATSVGVRPTRTPAASNASALACAVPLEPVTMAPACPIRLPGGAVNPAM